MPILYFIDYRAASFNFLGGLIFTIVLAGFAANVVGSLVNGLIPLRALVAGFLMVTILAIPGNTTQPRT